ncbi:MAG: P-type conjugative transfer protein TrbJ [Hyphomicrobiales bacterium]|nr:P-type conjugative transfer protein TrbJ [Hyphomicrobiales bacterium]
MMISQSTLKHGSAVAAICTSLLLMNPERPPAAWTVFDPWNYHQNILTASQTLTEINQQIDQLRNEAQMLINMDLNLTQLTETVAPDLARTLSEIQSLMDEANAVAMKVAETDEAMQRLFPDTFETSLTGDDLVQNARERWDEALASYKRSASLQAKISENVETDGDILSTLLSRSRSSVGNLQATQTGNELSGLAVKQSLQLQQLLATQARAETVDRAVDLAAEEESRTRFKNFMGSNSAYSAE